MQYTERISSPAALGVQRTVEVEEVEDMFPSKLLLWAQFCSSADIN